MEIELFGPEIIIYSIKARDLDIATDERQELDVENIPGELRYGSGEFRMIIHIFQTEWRENRPGLQRRK